MLRFENLSGDPALDWTSRALSEALPVSLAKALDGPVLPASALSRTAPSLGPRPAGAPGISTERPEALLAGATRVITGYVERAGRQIKITAVTEETGTGRTLRTVTAAAPSAYAAMVQLAHGFSGRAGTLLTANADALRAYATAFESTAGSTRELLEQASRLDPDFGAAWVALASFDLARNDRAAAGEVLQTARQRKLDPLSAARLELEDANLHNNRAGAVAAMRKVVALNPADTVMLRSLAELEITAGDFKAAAADWKTVTVSSPGDPLAWNSLGYARSYAGDFAGALAALQEYNRLRPKEANPADSIGDLNYSFGKFKEAAASYLEARKRQPDFQQSSDLYKAAWATFHAGDKRSADALFEQFRRERAKSSSDAAALIAADWLYRTGRQNEAMERLRKAVTETGSATFRTGAWAQLTIWDLLAGDRARAARDAAGIGNSVSSGPVLAARFSALPSAPAAAWTARAQTLFPPGAEALRLEALGYALLLDEKRDAALPVWGQIVSLDAATDFFARAIYTRLQGKPVERPLVPDAARLNQFGALLDKL